HPRRPGADAGDRRRAGGAGRTSHGVTTRTARPRQREAERQRPSRVAPPRAIAQAALAACANGGEGMLRSDKERVVAELTERLKTTDTFIVADYRGLTVTQIDDLRTELLKHGARFSVVKN